MFPKHRQEAETPIATTPDCAEAQNKLGMTLKLLGRNTEALDAYKTALDLKPDYAEAHSNMGVVLDHSGRHGEAVMAYGRAIELAPKLAAAYVNMAGSLWRQYQLGDAIATYAKALSLDPNHPSALIDYYHLCRVACDWDGLAATEQKILASTYRKGERVAPFAVLNMSCGPEEHLLSAREWAKGVPRTAAGPFPYTPPRSASHGARLRIGYLSDNFYGHASARAIAGLIERHDRSRFEVYGYCFSRDDGSSIRRRLMDGFDHFIRIGHLNHAEAAERIHADGIDILIDLKGYSAEGRPEILACRPAPIQVNYLGHPGPMGADFIDYVIADDFVLPADQQPFYDESIVHLPGCHQPNDAARPIAEHGPSRAACGLPDQGFVFCCFGQSYKITPEMFCVWMRLLDGVPGSVLWLLEANGMVRKNLQRRAIANGVDPARLVFAPKIELSKHLARHRLADLFLDTLPMNAHASASDALWAGLPVLTCAGESFPARVCGSLLQTAGLAELVTYSLEHYERTALSLARDPSGLAEIRDRLTNRSSARLFDIGRHARSLEAAFEHMAALRESGEGRHGFTVTEIGEDAPAGQPPLEPSARIADMADALCDIRDVPLQHGGARAESALQSAPTAVNVLAALLVLRSCLE